jgi:hypothetical protein
MELTALKFCFDETALLLMAPEDAWVRNQGRFCVFSSLLVIVVIGSAVIPTFVAQTWFLPKRVTPLTAEQREEVEAVVEE